MPRLSIIIPVLGSAARLETTLISVLENRPPDCEILVVHNAPYADPYDLAGEIRFLPVASRVGIVECVNEGIQASHGSVVHLLASGLEVAEDWTEPALEHFQDPRVASVSPVVVDSLDTQVTVASGLAYSCRWGRIVRTDTPAATAITTTASDTTHIEVLGPLVQAAFYRRSSLELVGGLPRAIGDGLADADLALALRFAGYKGILEPRSIVLATADCLIAPRPGFRHGLAAERLFWRAAPVVGWGKSIAAHPLGVLVEFVTALPRPGALAVLLGRALGVCQMGSHRAHQQWLLDVERAAAALFRAERAGRLRIDGPHTPGQSILTKRTHASARSAV
ncbi:MAG: glycosyltransferase family A protein [Pirellulales bacterium]